MIVYAAVDVRRGRAVQLVGGRPEEQIVNWPDPVKVARSWAAAGFKALHVVDLDAALGTGDNQDTIARVLDEVGVPVQVSGGIRDDARIEALLGKGAARVVIGTRALEDSAWRSAVADRYPGRIAVAADMRDGRLVTRGWTHDTNVDGASFIGSLRDEPLGAVLVTDVSREGSMQGVDIFRFETMVGVSRQPIVAAGGIRDVNDLRALAGAGVAGAVIGMALYTGRIRPEDVVQEFGNEDSGS